MCSPGRVSAPRRCGESAPCGAGMGHLQRERVAWSPRSSSGTQVAPLPGVTPGDARCQGGTLGLKDLLVDMDNDPTCSTRVDAAVALVATHVAHLTGLHVLTRTHPAVASELLTSRLEALT